MAFEKAIQGVTGLVDGIYRGCKLDKTSRKETTQ